MHRSPPPRRFSTIALVLLTLGTGLRCGGEHLEVPEEPEPAELLVIRGDRQVGQAGSPLPDSVVVALADAQGRPVADYPVLFGFVTPTAGGEVAPATARTDGSGRAAAKAVLGYTVGELVIEARVWRRGGGTLRARVAATAAPADPDSLTLVGGQDQGGRVGEALPDSLAVRVADRWGNPVPGVTVRWAVEGGGSVSQPTGTTGAGGRTAVARVLGSRAGSQSASAEVEGLHGSPIVFHHLAAPRDAAALLPADGGGQSGTVGATLPRALVVQAIDPLGNPIQGRAVRWRVVSGGGTVAAPEPATDLGGFAGAGWTLGTTAGEQSVEATASGLPTVAFRATALAGPAARIVIVTQPSVAARSGVPLDRQPLLQLHDAHRNLAAATGTTLVATIASGAEATLENAAAAAAGGEVAFHGLALSGPVGPYTLRFQAEGLAPAVSAALTLAEGPPARLVVRRQPSANAAAWVPFARQPTIEVRDGGGNLVDGVEVAAAIETGGGFLSGDLTRPSVAGLVAFDRLAIGGGSGARTLRFQAGPLVVVSASIAVTAPSEAIAGSWSAPFSTPVIAVHTALLPNGRVLLWGHQGEPQLWDPVTGFYTPVSEPAELFCGGHAFLPDGRLLVTGGHIDNGRGLPNATIFDFTTRTWSSATPMRRGRWYPTSTTLPNGEVLTVAGRDENNDSVPVPEVFTTAGAWRALSNAVLEQPYYPRMFVAPNGRVFNAGPARATRYLDTRGTGQWTFVANMNRSYRDYGSAVMYQPGKVMTAGGGGADSNSAPTASAEVIDLTQASPAWRNVGSMANARRHLNLSLLPTGEVLATGGSSAAGFNNLAGAVHAAEMWNPQTEQWRTLASNQVTRVYHSTSLLLPDGRVLHTGSGDGGGSIDERNAELFSPPYLFNGPRPVISSAPASVGYDQGFAVGTDAPQAVATVSLIRLGAVTHAYDQNQRLASLTFTRGAGELSVRSPANGTLAPPGHYLLFLVNDAGVPSVARIVRLQ
jgi:hypothetical protein